MDEKELEQLLSKIQNDDWDEVRIFLYFFHSIFFTFLHYRIMLYIKGCIVST